jgi:spectinomycin phosphotransferase
LQGVADEVVQRVVVDGWALDVARLSFLPEGGGAHHWMAAAKGGGRWFVTCDDLDMKPWLGADRETVFDRLCAAYGTARELAEAGCAFVVAPIVAGSGACALRMDDRYCVSVFEYVDGRAGQWGRAMPASATEELVTMLTSLHRTSRSPAGLAHRGLDVPGRVAFEVALGELDRRWDGGPLSEPARIALRGHRDVIVAWLDDLRRLISRAEPMAGGAVVVTHGEPHPGNLMSTATGWRLVDWDTVALSTPERDVWMLDDADGRARDLYRRLTGTVLDPEVLAAYRLSWALSDLAAFTVRLHDAHGGDADDRRALDGMGAILSGREPLPYPTMAA